MHSLPVTGERFIPGKMNDPGTATEPAAAANLAGLGKRIMAARNVNYRQ